MTTTTSAAPSQEASTLFLRPLGSSLPLGLAGFTVASLAFAAFDAHWINEGNGHAVALIVLATAVPLQLVATLFALLSRDGTSAVTMGLLGASWAMLGVELLALPLGATSEALGIALLADAALLVGSVVSSSSSNPLLSLVAALGGARVALLGLFHLSAADGWRVAGGYVGLAAAIAGAYAVWALQLEDARHRPVLPTFHRVDVAHDAGVRSAL